MKKLLGILAAFFFLGSIALAKDPPKKYLDDKYVFKHHEFIKWPEKTGVWGKMETHGWISQNAWNLKYEKTSFLSKSNNAFIEEMYVRFIQKDPNLPEGWKKYFESLSEETSIAIKELKGPSWGIKSQHNEQQLENIVFEKKIALMFLIKYFILTGPERVS